MAGLIATSVIRAICVFAGWAESWVTRKRRTKMAESLQIPNNNFLIAPLLLK
jgi:hypothetical protein